MPLVMDIILDIISVSSLILDGDNSVEPKPPQNGGFVCV